MATLALAMPQSRRGQKMAYALDEDEVTLAWEAVRLANLQPGSAVAAPDLFLPPWWWAGTRLVKDDKASVSVKAIPTTLGPSVAVFQGAAAPDVEEQAKAIHGKAPVIKEMDFQKIRVAREGPDTEADFPLGAFVMPARHDEVTALRLKLGPGKVVTWTTVAAGAAPTEFARLQDAVGNYHVVLVEFPDGKRTVGLWTDADPPATGTAARPVLRRLFRTQGSWRYGVKFAPS